MECPFPGINAVLADGKGGFWLGGQTALVHWRGGVSETYPSGSNPTQMTSEPGVWLRMDLSGSACLMEGPGGTCDN